MAGKMQFSTAKINNSAPSEVSLTRTSLERAMIRWTYQQEGTIGGEYILGLVTAGEVIGALSRVSYSMERKEASFEHNDVALVWTAWMNFQNFGSPGFPLSSHRDYLNPETVDFSDIEV